MAGRGIATGMLDEGADVLDIGQVGTEVLYWIVNHRELDGGAMCTASHNPAAYTGAKLVRARRCRSRATRASARSATWSSPTTSASPPPAAASSRKRT